MNDYLGLLRALSTARVEFVVVGGTAAVLHGATTATYDLDVLMLFTRENCERLLEAVGPLHPKYAHTPDKRPMQLTAMELAGFKNLCLLTDLGRLDVLGALPPIDDAQEVLRGAQPMDVGGVSVRVINLEHLIQVKAAMGRPKDKQTETELRAIASARKGRPWARPSAAAPARAGSPEEQAAAVGPSSASCATGRRPRTTASPT